MKYYNVIMMMVLAFLPGCCRFYDWGRKTFYQGEPLSFDIHDVRDQVKTVRVYREVVTAGIFDVLWLSEFIRQAYVQLYIEKHNKDEQSYNNMLRKQLNENDHFVSFYVLMYQYPNQGLLLLGDKSANWSVSLLVNNHVFHSISIKEVALPPEYRYFFGTRYNRFQKKYMVTFDAQDIKKKIMVDQVNRIILRFSTDQRCVTLSWNVAENCKRLVGKCV